MATLATTLRSSTVAALILLSACESEPERPSSTIARIDITGRSVLGDATPLPDTDIAYRLTLDGDELFATSGEKCGAMPDHGAGAFVKTIPASVDGAFNLQIPAPSIYAAVIPTCSLGELVSSRLRTLRLNASIEADPTTCAAYCRASEPSDSSCPTRCISGDRLIQAVATLTGADLDGRLAAAPGGVMSWAPTLQFTTLGPSATPATGVDLVVDGPAASATARISREVHGASSCEAAESCLRGFGQRTLLRFNSVISNLGADAMELGSPANNPLFHFDSCHNHYHLDAVLLYELIDPVTGQVVQVDGEAIVGRKTGFCMMDMAPVTSSSPSRGFTCAYQGISGGWSDEYEASLECQYVDVTGVPPGSYLLRMTVNPLRIFAESDLGNNVTEVAVVIP